LEALDDFLRSHTQEDLLPWSVQVEAANRFGLTYGEIEEAALEIDLLPVRYLRNRQSITIRQQLRLFRGKVAIIGCGGLGGYAVEEMARLGIGYIKIIDPDVFVEHNMNRQILSCPGVLGKPKVEVAAQRVKEINPAVTVVPVKESFTTGNGAELLQGINIALDALDTIPIRFQLAEICKKMNIPLVHGSIAGWYGQAAVQFPGEDILGKIYSRYKGKKGIETELGIPSFTPAVVASIQVAEVCKIILNEGKPLRQRMLSINLLDMEIIDIQL
jgi:molybdopterin/thiamine biosynthesis adenylyltransferase